MVGSIAPRLSRGWRALRRMPALAAVVATLVGLTTSFPSADARTLEATEKASLEKTVSEFADALKGADHERVASTMPPRLLELISKKAKVPVDAMRTAMIEQLRSLEKLAKIDAFSMDLGKADHQVLASGAPFAFVPTQARMTFANGRQIQMTSQTVAMLDGGKWYLLRVDDPGQIRLLREAYPEFSGVEIPAAQIEVLKK